MTRKILFPLLGVMLLSLAACADFGKVEQGRAVAFDKEKKVVTIIKDAQNGSVPDYSVLPAVEFALPLDPAETGAEPTPGLCLKLDTAKKMVTMYNPATKILEEIPFVMEAEHKGVDINKKHVLVYDTAANKPREFPEVNKDEYKVTIYARQQQLLVTFTLSPENFGRFQPQDWQFGDEVRIYYKTIGQSLRFMNITKTDIFKR